MAHSEHKTVLACQSESSQAAPSNRPSEGGRPHRKLRAFFYVASSAAMFGLILLLSSCSNTAAQKSRALAATLTPAAVPSPPLGVAIQSQNVYLDASMSMKGFVNPAHHSQFDEFIDSVGDLMPGCHLYKYGQRVGGKDDAVVERVSFGLELHQQSFYDLMFNPDDRLIERLATEEQSNLSILVTDGVYSEPQGATAPPVVQAAQHWMERGRTLGILIFRSDFDGRFYSERARNWLKLPPVKGRPFYAFVFSPTVKAFRDLQARFQQRFPEMRSLAFSNDAVSCAPALNERLKGTYSYKRPPEVPYYWHMFDSALFAQHNPAPVGYNVKCTLSPDYPATGLKFDVNADYYRWQNNNFQKAPSPPDGFRVELDPDKVKEFTTASGTASKASGESPPDFIVYFPKDAGGDYGFYHLRLTASPKDDLRPDIAELSTRDDRQPQDAAKTFRFSELISALTQIHFQSCLADKAGASIFVTIDNH